MALRSINPANGDVLKEFKEWNQTQIHKQLEKNKQLFSTWKLLPISERIEYLKKISKILRDNISQYAQLITLEMGKPISQAEDEIRKCAHLCNYYAKNGKKFLENEIIETDNKAKYIQFLPLGIILIIMPWNFPFWQVFRCAIPALLSGNCVVLKHSSNVPQCGFAIENIFIEAGLMKNTFTYYPISSKKIRELIIDPRISAVSLTGSNHAGAKTAGLAGNHIKKVVLELGGSDPFIILDDVDVEKTAKKAVKARMINNGQSCIAAKRFIIHKKIFNEFQESFKKQIEQLIVGNPLDRSTDIGPLAGNDLVNELDNQVKKSIYLGAEIITGGKRIENSKGFYYYPTVVKKVSTHMPIMKEETFGPVAPLIMAHNDTHAIEIANNTCYGLGASIWTDDLNKAKEMTTQIQSGTIFINEIVKSDPNLPFGGMKQSGFGRELFHYGVKEFVNIQSVSINNH